MSNQPQEKQGTNTVEDSVEKPTLQYFVEVAQAKVANRSMSLLIASRRCYECQQADDKPPTASSDTKQYIKRIAKHCGETSDYLMTDAPLKEAIFRVLLTGSNKPRTAEEISQVLSEKWALTAYPRELSPEVIQRLLDHSESYSIARVPEPEVEESEDTGEPSGEAPAEGPTEDEPQDTEETAP